MVGGLNIHVAAPAPRIDPHIAASVDIGFTGSTLYGLQCIGFVGGPHTGP